MIAVASDDAHLFVLVTVRTSSLHAYNFGCRVSAPQRSGVPDYSSVSSIITDSVSLLQISSLLNIISVTITRTPNGAVNTAIIIVTFETPPFINHLLDN